MNEQFKELSFKEKLEYLWDYYSAPFFFTLLILFIIFLFIYNMVSNTRKETYTGISFFGDYIGDETAKSLSRELTELFCDDPKQDVKIETFYASDLDPTIEVAMGQKFFAMFQTNQIDLVVFDKFYLEHLIDVGYLINLETFLDENLLKQYEENELLYFSKTEEYPETLAYAISLENSAYLKDTIGFDTANKYVGFARSCPRKEAAYELLLLLLS